MITAEKIEQPVIDENAVWDQLKIQFDKRQKIISRQSEIVGIQARLEEEKKSPHAKLNEIYPQLRELFCEHEDLYREFMRSISITNELQALLNNSPK